MNSAAPSHADQINLKSSSQAYTHTTEPQMQWWQEEAEREEVERK